MFRSLVEAEVGLHAFEGLAFGFGVEEEDGEELHHHHCGEEGEGQGFGVDGYVGEDVCNDSVGDPVGGRAEGLALGADVGGEDFGEVDPDDGPLRDGEGDDEGDEEGEEQVKMFAGVEYPGDSGEGEGAAYGSDEEEGLAADLIDDGDADEGREKVGETYDDRLHIAGHGTEAGIGEDVVEVVEDCVDSGELVEEADGDGEEDELCVAALEEGVLGEAALGANGFGDGVDFGARVG